MPRSKKELALLERAVIALESLAKTMADDGPLTDPGTTLNIDKPVPFIPPAFATEGERCFCGDEQMFHAAGQGPCQRPGCGCKRFRSRVYHPPTPKTKTRSKANGAVPANEELRPSLMGNRILQALLLRGQPTPLSQLAVWAGYRKSGSFNNTLSALRSHGYIQGGRSGIALTEDGRSWAGGPNRVLPRGRDLLAHWAPQLNKMEHTIAQFLRDHHPEAFDKQALAEAVDYRVSGSFNNSLSRLRTLELIEGYDAITATLRLGART